jgi:transposase
LIETAKANGLETYGYLRRLFQELPKAESLEAIEALLPWHSQSVTDAFPESKPAVA